MPARISATGICRRPVCSWVLALVMMVTASICMANDDLSATNSTSATETSAPVEFRDGRLSVRAKNTPIVALMQMIGAEAGFDVISYGDLDAQAGSWSFSDLPLGDALRKLLRDINTVVVYRSGGEPGAEAGLSKIYLLGSNSGKTKPIKIQTVEPGLDNQLRIDQAQGDDQQERLAAIDRSEGMADEITLENLSFALRHDPDPEVRARAVTALESIGGAAAVTALEGGMGDSEPAVRKKVIQAFGKIDDERIPLWLGQVLMGDPEPDVRLTAVQAIARKEGDITRIFLQAATGDSSSLVRDAALQLSR